MATKYIDSRGQNREGYSMYEYVYDFTEHDGRRIKDTTHTNYAETMGVGLFNCHQWLQKIHGHRLPDYAITQVRRRLREIKEINGKKVKCPTDEYVEIKDFPRGNPVTPPMRLPKPEIQDPSMPFIADVTVTEKPQKKGKK